MSVKNEHALAFNHERVAKCSKCGQVSITGDKEDRASMTWQEGGNPEFKEKFLAADGVHFGCVTIFGMCKNSVFGDNYEEALSLWNEKNGTPP